MVFFKRHILWSAAVLSIDLLLIAPLQADPKSPPARDDETATRNASDKAEDGAQRGTQGRNATDKQPEPRRDERSGSAGGGPKRDDATPDERPPRRGSGAARGKSPPPDDEAHSAAREPVQRRQPANQPQRQMSTEALKPVRVRVDPVDAPTERADEEEMVRVRGTEPDPSPDAEPSDERGSGEDASERKLRMRIQSKLHDQRELSTGAKLVSIDVDGSQVTLKGQVRTHRERHAVERTARATPGVQKVDNQLRVRNALYQRPTTPRDAPPPSER